ncbi:PD-(D/E)XK nuclease family protein [Rufibacter glacialis]|nr:PD-(D/E)XK nuclease family protein [Rufibacter glacialis]
MIEEYEKLIKEFYSLPKVVPQPTYLELCQYPYRRLKEICSRMLSFFLQPTAEHGMDELFIQSLAQTLQEDLEYRTGNLRVIVEDNAEGKRIDLVVAGENFVIGIENKITAGLYNPLDKYREKLSSYQKEKAIGVVLSLRRVQRREEVDWMRENGFVNILYSELFTSVKQNIGFYLGKSSDKYLIYLQDFIKTIENMEGNNTMNQPLADFFFDNAEKVDELVKLYNEFNNKITQIRNQHINSLREAMSEKTGENWWIWSGFDLGFTFHDTEGRKLGIESVYEKEKRNPIGRFNIQITAWNIKDWDYFRSAVTPLFPDNEVQYGGGKANFRLDPMLNPTEEQITERLFEIYSILKHKVVEPIIEIQLEAQTLN